MAEVTDCVACLIRPLLVMGSVCGSSVMSFTCPHIKNRSSSTKFVHSQVSSLISLLFFLSLFAMMMNCVYDMFISVDELNMLLKLTQVLLSGGGLIFAVFGLVKHNQKILELNGLTSILENRRNYGFRAFFNAPMTKKLQRRCYLLVVFVISGQLNNTLIMLDQHKGGGTALLVFNLSLVLMYSHIYSMSFYQLLFGNCLYNIIFAKCFNRVRSVLQQRAYQENIYFVQKGIVQVVPKEFSVEDNLKRLRCLYMSLIHNYKQLNKFLQPAILLWWIGLIAILIINFYLQVVTSAVSGDMSTVISSYGIAVFVIVYLAHTERLNVVSQDILSFLFKYPISKLNTAEAAQVEMLITTLNIQKPVLRASDIFTVGTRLLASISGTVVTYVLVALQFRASWVKH